MNSTAGTDLIDFAIPGGGVKTIKPISELPWITETITINGFSQGGLRYKGPPLIELNGSFTSGVAGLVLSNTSNSVIRGLIINQFQLGLGLIGGAGGHIIKSNYIGTDPTGTSALGNTTGLSISSCPNNQIGVGGRNLISGNDTGIYIEPSSGNIIQGNYIGTDITGTQLIGNMYGAIFMAHSSKTTISSNVITGGQFGVQLEFTTGASILGNYFCTDRTGTTMLGDLLYAVFIRNSSSNDVGDVSPGLGNVIACYAHKVYVDSGTDNSIRGNSMWSSLAGHIGIDLAPVGITPNDFRDFDTGPNDLQNFPTVNDAVNNGPTTIVFGSLSSSSGTEFVIDFYSSSSCSPRGMGDGESYLGSITVITGRSPFVSFQASLPVSVPVGQVVTATATTTGGINNTSEFSNCAVVHFPN